jgi:hypothetical protein
LFYLFGVKTISFFKCIKNPTPEIHDTILSTASFTNQIFSGIFFDPDIIKSLPGAKRGDKMGAFQDVYIEQTYLEHNPRSLF